MHPCSWMQALKQLICEQCLLGVPRVLLCMLICRIFLRVFLNNILRNLNTLVIWWKFKDASGKWLFQGAFQHPSDSEKKKKVQLLICIPSNHSGPRCTSHQCTLFFWLKHQLLWTPSHYVSGGICACNCIHWTGNFWIQSHCSSQRCGSLLQTSFVEVFKPPYKTWCKKTACAMTVFESCSRFLWVPSVGQPGVLRAGED